MAVPAAANEPTAEQIQFFETKVRPVLANNCYQCHGEDRQRGELRLDSLSRMLAGGESGPAIAPGEPDESLFIEAINYASYEMPPTGMLEDHEIAALTDWVKMGAPWPGDDGYAVELVERREKITDEDRSFWSFQPVERPPLPEVDDGGWSKNEVDLFTFQKLEAEGLTPAAEADRIALMRRAYFDLVGLPPTPQEIDEYLADQSPQAYEDMVDRLLESPRYGERWARHWLDLVRYAESDGFRQDAHRPHAWRYRDYVIRAFNDDKPYDQFVMEQLAGDEIAPEDPDVLVATGLLRHWLYEYNQRDVRTQWSDILNDVTDVAADVFLGLGMSCARCHDHKFDPILQKDYYSLQAFFTPMLPRDDLPLATPEQQADYLAKLAEWEEKTAEIRKQIDEIERPHLEQAAEGAIDKFPKDIRAMMRKPAPEREPLEHQLAEMAYQQVIFEYDRLNVEGRLKGEEQEKWKALRKQLAEFDQAKPAPLPPAAVVTDVGASAPPTIIPGDRTGENIEPGFPTVLDAGPPSIESPAASESTGRRTALARWLTQPDHPLTTRVIANRVWQYHFGRGLVNTPSDFGRLGEPPSHPELLDWLAAEFVEQGWSFKQMHRLIMTSATYRQTALRESPEIARLKDPENRLLWRTSTRRLDAEQIRDAMLAASGELESAAGGPSVDAARPRRSIYTKVIRNTRDPLLAAFDAADGFSSTAQRNVTTTPTQALLLINGPWTHQRAQAFAKRLQEQQIADDEQLVAYAYRTVFGREPEPAERAAAVAFLDEQGERIVSQQGPLAAAMPGRGGQAARFEPAGGLSQLSAPDHPSLPDAEFTIEAFVLLQSVYDNAAVRTIAAQWDGDTNQPGWSLGVTSKQSKYKPQNLILQLVDDPAKGGAGYQVLASGLHVELDKPYYVAASVKLADSGQPGVTFYLQDLSRDDAELQTAHAPHQSIGRYRSTAALTLGGRDRQPGHQWRGLIDDVRLSNAALDEKQLLIHSNSTTDNAVGFWRFEDSPGFYKDSSQHGNHLQPSGEGSNLPDAVRTAALIDLCHVLLNSNEFLYLD